MYSNVEGLISYWFLHVKWKCKYSNINGGVFQRAIINAVIDLTFYFSCTFICLFLPIIYLRILTHESNDKIEPDSCSTNLVSTLIHNFMPF